MGLVVDGAPPESGAPRLTVLHTAEGAGKKPPTFPPYTFVELQM